MPNPPPSPLANNQSATAPAVLDDASYHALAEAVLRSVERQADDWLQDDVIDIDVKRSGGMLELQLPGRGGVLVLTLQPPLQELWLAARGGGFHYRWDGERWVDTRGGPDLIEALSQHASTQAGQALRFSAPSVS